MSVMARLPSVGGDDVISDQNNGRLVEKGVGVEGCNIPFYSLCSGLTGKALYQLHIFRWVFFYGLW